MAKPTGGKNGAPKKPVNEQLKYELDYEGNTGRNWDSLFDLYNYFEARNAPQSVLSLIENLIAMEAEPETLEIKEIVEALTTRVCGLTDLEAQKKCLEYQRLNFIKMRTSAPFEATKIMLSKVLGHIEILQNSSLLLSRKDLERMYDDVGKDLPSESSFILEEVNKLGKDDLSHISLEVFEKVFRSATYNQYKSVGEKRAYLRRSFQGLSQDYWWKLHSRVHHYNPENKPEQDLDYPSDEQFKKEYRAEAKKRKLEAQFKAEPPKPVKTYSKKEIKELMKKKKAA